MCHQTQMAMLLLFRGALSPLQVHFAHLGTCNRSLDHLTQSSAHLASQVFTNLLVALLNACRAAALAAITTRWKGSPFALAMRAAIVHLTALLPLLI